MPDRLQPELKAKLDESAFDWFDIAIEFSEMPSPEELASLDLQPEGNVAFGRANKDRILAFLRFPQVRFIKLQDPPQASASGELSHSRLGADLETAMLDSSKAEFDVIVAFRRSPESPPLPEHLVIFHDIGSGRLSRDQIQELARHEDVMSINLRPEMRII